MSKGLTADSTVPPFPILGGKQQTKKGEKRTEPPSWSWQPILAASLERRLRMQLKICRRRRWV